MKVRLKLGVLEKGRHNSVVLLQILIFCILIIYMFINISDKEHIANWEAIVSNIAIFLTAEQLFFLMVLRYRIFSFQFFMVCLNSIFMFGQLIINAYNLNALSAMKDCRLYFDNETLWQTGLYVLCCVQAFYMGMIFKDDVQTEIISEKDGKFTCNRVIIARSGIILLIISGVCRLYTDFRYIFAAQATGRYDATFELAQTGLVDDFAWLVLPAMYMIIVGKKLDQKKGLIFCGIAIAYFLSTAILTGIRRFPVSAILSIILFYFNYYKIKIGTIRLIVMSTIVVIFLGVLASIRRIRATGLMSLGGFITNYMLSSSSATGAVLDTLAEFGVSYFSVSNVITYVPQYHFYQLGIYFIYCMLVILPIGPILNHFAEGSLTGAANRFTGLGIGASLFGDMFANFGYFGIIATGIFAFLIMKWMRKCKEKDGDVYYIRYYTLVFAFINLARGSIGEMVRLSVWLYIIPIIIVKYIKIGNILCRGKRS